MATGFQQVQREIKRLRSLTEKGALRAQRTAMRKATSAAAKIEKQFVPVDQGVLKKDQTSKVTGGNKYGIAGVVGADAAKLNEQAEESHDKRPNNIDWLVDQGHVAPDGTVIPPSGYIEEAEEAGAATVTNVYTKALADAIDKEVARG